MDDQPTLPPALVPYAATPTITARIKLRNDHGPDGTLGDPQEFVLIDGLYYPKRWIKSGQGLRREQLELNSPSRAREG